MEVKGHLGCDIHQVYSVQHTRKQRTSLWWLLLLSFSVSFMTLLAPSSETTSFVVDAFTSSSIRRKEYSLSPVVTKTSLQQSSVTNGDSSDPRAIRPQHLVLIGGGHAHVQVIKALNRGARPPHLHVTLIDAVAAASYSGMVPGCLAGCYTDDQTRLHLAPLAEWADIHFIQDTVVDIDFQEKFIYLKESPLAPISFDVVSMDIGSTSRGYTTCPGAVQYAIPTRPIDQLIKKLEYAVKVAPLLSDAARRLVVIGGGIAGIELSMVICSRWERDDQPFDECVLLDSNPNGLLPYETVSTRQVVQQILEEKNIRVQYGCTVESIEESHVQVASGTEGAPLQIPYTLCIWSTGAGAHALSWHLQKTRGLPCDENGWICVAPTLQSIRYPFVFAAGDCATIQVPLRPSPPKAGVFAVRSGPILIENLTRYLESIHPDRDPSGENGNTKMSSSELMLQPYIPQNDFLKLLVCGDGTALGFRFGLVLRGRWVFQLKDSIDQKFMKLFDVSGEPKPEPRRSIENGFVRQYDTRQYDNAVDREPCQSPHDAALLLQRTDDDVDFEQARRILSCMGEDSVYRDAVLQTIHQTELQEVTH